jgi:hypothetical protein
MKYPALLAAISVLCLTISAFAADKYQITGPVVELTDTKIVVTKGAEKERHEFVRNADTKITGELKVGAKVTVHYTMISAAVEVKENGAK